MTLTDGDIGRLLELLTRYRLYTGQVKQVYELSNWMDAPDIPAEIVASFFHSLSERCGFRDRDNLREWLEEMEVACYRHLGHLEEDVDKLSMEK